LGSAGCASTSTWCKTNAWRRRAGDIPAAQFVRNAEGAESDKTAVSERSLHLQALDEAYPTSIPV
jgi:hypothetical protein